MPKRSSKKKQRPIAQDADGNQLTRAIADEAADDEVVLTADGKNAAAVALGRLGGKKGGPARAEKLSTERRAEIARKAAKARWSKGPRHRRAEG